MKFRHSKMRKNHLNNFHSSRLDTISRVQRPSTFCVCFNDFLLTLQFKFNINTHKKSTQNQSIHFMHNLSVPLFNIHVLSTFCFGHWANVVQLQLTIFDCHTKSKLSVKVSMDNREWKFFIVHTVIFSCLFHHLFLY